MLPHLLIFLAVYLVATQVASGQDLMSLNEIKIPSYSKSGSRYLWRSDKSPGLYKVEVLYYRKADSWRCKLSYIPSRNELSNLSEDELVKIITESFRHASVSHLGTKECELVYDLSVCPEMLSELISMLKTELTILKGNAEQKSAILLNLVGSCLKTIPANGRIIEKCEELGYRVSSIHSAEVVLVKEEFIGKPWTFMAKQSQGGLLPMFICNILLKKAS